MSFAGTSRVGLSFSFPPLRRCSGPGDAMELFVSPHNVCKNLLNIQWNIRGCNFGNGTSPVIFSCLSLPVNSLSMVPTYLMPRVKILQNWGMTITGIKGNYVCCSKTLAIPHVCPLLRGPQNNPDIKDCGGWGRADDHFFV